MLARSLFSCLAVSFYCVQSLSAAPANENGIDVAKLAEMATATPAAKPKTPPKRFPKFEDVTKDMVSKKGLFTLWHYPPDAKDKNPQKLLCQIPKGFLGENFMLSVSFSGGGFFTGFPLEERVVRWELLDKQLVLVEPDTGFVADKKHTVSDVVRRTYPERIRTAVPIVTKSKGGDPVIDLGAMLKGNFADIAWTNFGQGGGAIRANLSKWTKRKVFELNVEIGVELAVSSKHPPGSYDKKLVHFSFWKLPDTGYKTRIADDRIGYFLTANRDWAKPTEARDIFNRYIDRWQLVKRDPTLSTCEPIKPIVFYVEKTVPVRFRKAVRDGILEWNRAFEKIGFVNAVEVRQQTGDNEWKDLDPEDMRYSFFRWIVTGAGFAMGPHRANPFTGQIYDADIVFDDSLVRFLEAQAQTMLPSAALAMKMRDPALEAFFERFPQWKRPGQSWESFMVGGSDEAPLLDTMRRRMRERGYVGCDYAEGMKHQFALAHAVLAGQPKEVMDRLLYDVIKEIVTHEVGHTLGLRHNFKASSIYTLDQIKQRRKTDEPTCGSVMDYNPILFFAQDSLEGHFSTPTVGPYDYWAIEYGYRPVGDKPPTTAKGDAAPDEAEGAKKAAEEASAASSAATPETRSRDANHSPTSEDVGHPSGSIRIAGEEIPKELLDQLPPEAVKILADRAADVSPGGTSVADEKPGEDKPTDDKPSKPAFTGPNAKELKMLNAIASRAAEPELAYATDEDTTILGADPLSNRFDMGSDPIEWATNKIEVVNRRLDNILEWAVKERESWYHMRQAFVTLMVEKTFVLDFVGRYVGGQYTARNHRGDPQEVPPLKLVEPQLQRNALAFVEEHLFQDEFFSVPPEVLNHLSAPRWWHSGTRVSYTVDFPIHRMVSFLQWWNLFDRLFPPVLRRIHDAELKTTAADKLTVAEYLQRIQSACWSDAAAQRANRGTWTDASPFLSSIRRSLQREYLNLAEPLVRIQPGAILSPDLHAMVQHSLQRLADQLGQTVATGKLDFASHAHVASCKSRIDRMLTPRLDEFGW